MAKKISDLDAATDITSSDLFLVVDVEDADMATTGTNKKATAQVVADELAGLSAVISTPVQDALNLKQNASTAVTGVAASAADVLSISGNDIVADDPNEDRLVFWDDSAGKLIYAGLGPGLYTNSAGTLIFNSMQKVFIPADHWYPRTTAGAGTATEEFATYKTNWKELLFDASTVEYAQTLIQLPSNLAQTPLRAVIYFATTGTSNTVVWGIKGRFFLANDNLPLDSDFGTAATASKLINGSADTMYSVSIDFTPAGTGNTDRPLLLEVYRDATNGSDTSAVDAKLLGVQIQYNLSY